MHYKCTTGRDVKSEKGIIWNDLKLKIKWPGKSFLISKKDQKLSSLNDFQNNYKSL